ncbi:hypothetical protein COO60DRAFT_892528 [Scenedesmus sp. NREL 46B-D3]|nr:hypothetical protein COO60DRAFT_892528 [Scenedesmus sp. NREL 46B-D3]
MQDNDQHSFLGAASADLAARTAGGKPKTREVKARYLQAKPTPASRRQLPAASRSSQAFQSAPAGWVELQLPNHHAHTPLMVNTAAAGSSASACFTQAGKPRRATAQPTPASGAAQQRALLQERRLQQQAALVTPSASQQAGRQQRQLQQQHDVAPMSDTVRRASVPGPQPPLHDTTVGGALISPGSSRSSTSCSLRPGHDVDAAADNSATHTRHHGSVAAAASGAELQTPQVSRLAASMGPGCQSAVQLGRMGMSVDIGSAMRGSSRRPSDKEAAELKAKLEAYKASKQQQSARGAPVSGRGCSQGAFKAPAPKTMFKGAAASMAGLVKAPDSARCPPGASRVAPARATPSAAAMAATPAAAVPAAPTPSSCTAAAGGSASAFTATMATLQHTGSGSKASRPPSSGGKQQGLGRPAGVPALPMDWLQQASAGSTATPGRTQLLRRASLPGSATKIPTLNLSAATAQQRQQQHEGVGMSVPLSSRRVSIAAHVPLPDATPRAFRDAPPSRLPKTPRGPMQLPAGEPAPARAAAVAGPSLKLAGLSAAAGSHSTPASGSMSSRHRPRPAAAAAAAAAAAHPPSSSRASRLPAMPGPAGPKGAGAPQRPAAARRQPQDSGAAAPATELAAAAQQHDSGARLTARGHRVVVAGAPAAAGAAADSSLTASLCSVHSTAGHAAARQAGQEGAEGVRQQLRLLRMQHLQLRHLNSKMETALEAKNEKANTAIAAAAAAVVDLCGELQALRGHLQQEQWRVELEQVLQRQLPKLQAWADLQAQHSSNLSQLQAACRTALSHVPLLNGASVGHHLEAPDLELLQRQLVHGMQLLQEVQPALQQLLGADLDTVSSKRRNSDTHAAAAAAVGPSGTQQGAEAASGGQQSISAFTQQPHQGRQHAQSSIKTTAALAEQLMSAASEECSLLGQLAQQLSQLSDLHLYANSMQVQLEQMKQAAVVQRGI